MHTTLRRAFAPSAAPAMSRQLRPQLPWPAPIARPHWRAIASLACAPPSADRSGPRGARGFGRGGAALLAATAAATLASDDAGTSGEPHGINTTWAPLGLLGPVLAGGGGSGGGVAAGSGPRQRMGESGGLRDGAPIPAVGRGGFPPESDPADFINNLGVDLTLGTVAGFCAGYALKKVSKAAAVAVGLGFIGVQLARHHGLISDVDWHALEARLVAVWDADGDGRVTGADVRTHARRVIDVLGFNMPSGAAFAAAFVLGLRAG